MNRSILVAAAAAVTVAVIGIGLVASQSTEAEEGPDKGLDDSFADDYRGHTDEESLGIGA